MNRYIKGITLATTLVLTAGCTETAEFTSLSHAEKEIINNGDGLMRVLTIDNYQDSLQLRKSSTMFTNQDLQSAEYKRLAERMVLTVTDPSEDGVGIAGPQVGLLRRVVAVQRFDKEGYPFEVYPNITIQPIGDACRAGTEGCLSVPDKSGTVNRYESVIIRYSNPETLETVQETIEGFTAVIFQHECDHLEGILYIDRIIN